MDGLGEESEETLDLQLVSASLSWCCFISIYQQPKVPEKVCYKNRSLHISNDEIQEKEDGVQE